MKQLNFVKIGNKYINLDLTTRVIRLSSGRVDVLYNNSDDWTQLEGDDATTFLDIMDAIVKGEWK